MKTNARNMLENDPRLTAYALGELAGDDAAAVEALLADSPAALAEVEAIRVTAASIRGALGGTATGLALSEAGRAAILESAASASVPARIIRHPLLRWGTTLTAAAASLALVATLWRAPSVSPATDRLSDEFTVASRYGNPNSHGLSKAVDVKRSGAYLIYGGTQIAAAPQSPREGQTIDYFGQANALPRPIRPGDPPPSSRIDATTLGIQLTPTSPPTNDAYFGRNTTLFTSDVQGTSDAADWTGSEEIAWRYAGGKPAQGLSASQPMHYIMPDVRASFSIGTTAGVRDPNSAAYRHNLNVPSSRDTVVDLRYIEGDIPLLPALFGHETIMITGYPEDIAHIEEVLQILDAEQVPLHQDILYPKHWLEIPASNPSSVIQPDLRAKFAIEIEARDVSALQNAARRLYDAHEYADAEQVLRIALEIDSGNEMLHHLQQTYSERANLTRQEERRAILAKTRAEWVSGLFKLAENLRRAGSYDAAANAVEQVRLIDPQNPSIATTLAQIQQEDRASRDNPFLESLCRPLSTFSIDVDTAAYSLVRQTLAAGQLPRPESVRIEELINYFDYDYPPPTDDRPFAANLEIAACPWQPAHRLVRVGLKGQVVHAEQRPVANLVFLIDVSGSMNEPAKLPMVKNSLRMLVDQLFDDDRVAIVVYAGAAGLVLPSTPASQRETILAAIDNLSAGGSTDGGSGITLAYDTATRHFLSEGINRVVLATDGDFNVGITDRGQLETLIAERAKTGVFLTTLGFGYRSMNDKTLETLADKGNGHYAIIDTLDEAKKVLVDNVGGTLQTIAKDVKIQVEFNPATVAGYRLIGYENRMLAARDFNDDTKDAGEIGAGHTVTALYEVVPVGVAVPQMSEAALAKLPPEDSLRNVLADEGVDPLKYQTPGEWVRSFLPAAETEVAEPDDDASHRRHADDGVSPSAWHPASGDIADAEVQLVPTPEIMTLKLRYKLPDGDVSRKIEFGVADRDAPFDAATDDFRFASAVAAYGMLLRNSIYAGEINMAGVAEIAGGALGIDESGRRSEFVELARRASVLLSSRTTN